MVNLKNTDSQEVDDILRQITRNLEERLDECETEHDIAYDGCSRHKKIDTVSPASVAGITPQADYLEQLKDLVTGLQRDSEPLHLALRRRIWQQQAVDNDKSATRQSAISQQETGEPYHKGRKGLFRLIYLSYYITNLH